MYKSIQAFRIYGCHKWQSTRTKTLDYTSKWVHPLMLEEELSPNHIEFLKLFNSLITNCSYCNSLPIFLDVEKKTFNTFELEEDTILEALILCAKNEGFETYEDPHFPYSLKTISDNLIALTRNYPS